MSEPQKKFAVRKVCNNKVAGSYPFKSVETNTHHQFDKLCHQLVS